MSHDREDDYNPFAAPVSDLAPDAFRNNGGEFVYGSFFTRFAAAFVDGIIVQVIVFVVSFVIGLAFVAISGPNNPQGQLLLMIVVQVFAQVVAWLYFALQESSGAQATIGKRMAGLRVLGLSGEQLSFGRATGRYFGKIISVLLLFVGYLMQPFTARKQALHDIMAGAIVVKG